MRAGAHSRIVFAGFGVTGSLLAAVGTIFVVAGGVLAFDHWPGSPGASPEQSLSLARAASAPRAAPVPAVALPPAGVSAGRAGSAGGPNAPSPSRRPTTRGSGASVTPVPALDPVAPLPSAPAQISGDQPPRQSPLAAAVQSATGATAHAVRSAGASLPAVAPVTDLVAATFDGAGRAVGGLLGGR